jgi:hypothetical protein
MKRSMTLAIVAACTLLPAAAAFAFPFGKSWHEPAHVGRAGAGGIYGMGGASDWGVTCAHCHIEGKGVIGATIAPTGGWPQVNGQDGYVPGTAYDITVTMTGEHRGLNQGTNNLNGFALTFEDAAGKVRGILGTDSGVSSASCPAQYPQTAPTGTTYVYGDCHGVFFVPKPNAVSWKLKWTAPAKGSGTINLFYGVVDGDANGKSSRDDDVKMGTIKLLEGP